MARIWVDLFQSILLPKWVSRVTSLATSVISGMFFKVTGESKSRVAGIRATTEFLEPEGVISPDRV